MRGKLHFKHLLIGAVALGLSLGISAHAETSREEMVHAFHLLKKANHDYGGHRVKAMHELEVAGRDLGLEMGGDLPERERQWKSDEQLIEARRILREARDKLEARDRDHAADRIEHAIKEIDTALEVK